MQWPIQTYMLPGCKVSDEMRRTSRLAGYVSRQMKHYALDFDDLMNVTKYILDHFQDAAEHWQNALNYIMVDEAQDCNLDDWDLVERLSARHRNLFVVGDPDQAIYEWRGARPDLFVNFAADRTIILDENYRSTPRILDVANCVIANNQNRIPKNLFTRKAEGKAVIHFHGRSEKEEMEWIVSQIRMALGSGAGINDIAILYRSTHQSRAIEQELLNAHLEYTIWGGTRFFERKEIKDALSYLRLVSNQDDDLSFERIINVPSRKLGRKFLDSVRETADREGISLYSALQIHFPEKASAFIDLIEDAKQFARENRVSDLLNRLLEGSGYKRMVREDQDEDRLENLDELLSSIRFYESVRTPDESTLADYLQDIALYTNDDHRRDTPTLKLMTIHQAKGLEFPYVFIIGLSEGIFPNMRTIREGKKNGEEEERRLMYVAVTRAEKALFLTESEGYNVSTKTNKYPSRFLLHQDEQVPVPFPGGDQAGARRDRGGHPAGSLEGDAEPLPRAGRRRLFREREGRIRESLQGRGYRPAPRLRGREDCLCQQGFHQLRGALRQRVHPDAPGRVPLPGRPSRLSVRDVEKSEEKSPSRAAVIRANFCNFAVWIQVRRECSAASKGRILHRNR